MARWIDFLAVEEVDTPTLLEWQPAGGIGGLVPADTYTFTAVHLTDLAGNAVTAGATFTHLNTTAQMLLLAYQAPTDTQPQAQAAYGLTTLFQGRTWHQDLGMYFYRARWHLPEAGVFGERDPLGPVDSMNLYQVLGLNPGGILDPEGSIGALTTEYNYGIGGNKLPQGQEAWDKYFESQSTNPQLDRFREQESGLGLLFDLNDVLTNLERGNLLPAVDFVARHRFGVEPTDDRRSWGIVIRLAFGIPYEGVALGDNIQFFPRGEAGVVASIYTFDTTHHWEDERWRENPIYGPMAFQGVEATIGIGMDYAVNIAPKNNAGYSGNELTNSWAGYFHELSFSPPGSPVGVSGFGSRRFIGVSYSVGQGLGALSLTHTYFHRRVGPVRLSSPLDVVALTMVYWQSAYRLPWVREEINRRLGE